MVEFPVGFRGLSVIESDSSGSKFDVLTIELGRPSRSMMSLSCFMEAQDVVAVMTLTRPASGHGVNAAQYLRCGFAVYIVLTGTLSRTMISRSRNCLELSPVRNLTKLAGEAGSMTRFSQL